MAAKEKRPHPPIFDLYSIDEISGRLGYAEITVAMIKNGQAPLTKSFRFRAMALLDHTEAELFGEVAG